MNKINYKTLFWWLAKILIFMAIAIAIWRFFALIKPPFLKYIDKFFDKEFTQIKTGVSIFFGFLDICISAFVTSYVESVFVAKQDFPRIFITSSNRNARNVSGLKMTHSCDKHLCVEIGKSQPKFRIIYARIKNTGKSIISECIINNKKINVTLEPDQSSELYFVVYESVSNVKSNYNFKFPYCLRDDQGNVYIGKYCMEMNKSESIATFRALKKIRRSILKNALPNL